MKRIFISLLLLAACVSGAVAETLFVSRSGNSYIGEIETIDGYMLRDDFANALAVCEDVNRRWTDTAPFIDILLIHDYVDGIGLSMAQMQAHIENGNPDMYFAESEKAKKALASIKDSEYPYVENIL